MTRLFLATALVVLATTSLASCSGGFDTEDATTACNEEEVRLPNCFDQAVYDQCVACHEECGDACGTVETVCPAKFSCPAE